MVSRKSYMKWGCCGRIKAFVKKIKFYFKIVMLLCSLCLNCEQLGMNANALLWIFYVFNLNMLSIMPWVLVREYEV
jgi:hypothetical protein